MKTGLKAGLAIVGVIVAVFLIAVGGVYLRGLFVDTTAGRTGETEAKILTEGDGSYRIGAYTSFYDACAAVITQEQRIKNMQEQLDVTEDPYRKDQLSSAITASKNIRAELINDYNSLASQDKYAGQFQAADLPPTINLNQETTVCAW